MFYFCGSLEPGLRRYPTASSINRNTPYLFLQSQKVTTQTKYLFFVVFINYKGVVWIDPKNGWKKLKPYLFRKDLIIALICFCFFPHIRNDFNINNNMDALFSSEALLQKGKVLSLND